MNKDPYNLTMAIQCELAVSHGTVEWVFISVYSFMLLKMGFICKSVVTIGVTECFFICVNSCSFGYTLSANSVLQCVQLNGFSSVWIISCFLI